MSRRWLEPEAAADLGRLDPEAIARVRAEAWPEAANADELHDALVWLGFLTRGRSGAGPGWSDWLAELARDKRVARLDARGTRRCGSPPSACRSSRRCGPTARLEPAIAAPAAYAERDWSRDEALVEILRGRLEGLGPVTRRRAGRAARACAATRSPPRSRRSKPKASPCAGASRRERTPRNGASAGCWRASIATPSSGCAPRSSRSRRATSCASCSAGSASPPTPRMEGPDAVDAVVGQLEGFEAPAGAWESEILPARLAGYEPAWLDDRCLAGRVAWTRLRPRAQRTAQQRRPNGSEAGATPVRTTPITLLARRHAALWALAVVQRRRRPARAAGRSSLLDYIRAARRLVLRRARGRHRPAALRRSRRRWPSWWRSAS